MISEVLGKIIFTSDDEKVISCRFSHTNIAMSSIPAPVHQVLQAQNDAGRQQINTAILRKGLDIQQQTGDAIISMLEQAAEVQRQIADGHIDVKV